MQIYTTIVFIFWLPNSLSIQTAAENLPLTDLAEHFRAKRDATKICRSLNLEEVRGMVANIVSVMNTKVEEEHRTLYENLRKENKEKNDIIDYSKMSCEESWGTYKRVFADMTVEYWLLKMDTNGKSGATSDDCEEKNQKLQMKIEELENGPAAQSKEKAEKLEEDLSVCKYDYNAIYDQMETVTNKYKTLYRKSIIEKIKLGQIDDAFKEFNISEDIDEIEPIVEGSYSVASNSTKVMDFISRLPKLAQETKGYETLYEVMDRRGDLQEWPIISLNYYIRKALKKESLPSIMREVGPILQSLLEKTDEPVKEAIGKMAEQLRFKQDIKGVATFAYDRQDAFTYIIEELVKRTYNDDFANVRSLMMFSNELLKIEQSARVYIELYNELQANNQINLDILLEIAFKIKELTEYPNYKNVKMEDVKISLEGIKKAMAPPIVAIIWNTVCIKNVNKGGNMFEEDAYMDNRRKVVLSKSKSGSYKWKFEAREDTKYFRIRNNYSKQYLYASVKPPHELFTGMNQKPMTWGDFKLLDKDWKNGEFYLASTNSTGSVEQGYGYVKADQSTLLADLSKTGSSAWTITMC